MTRNGTTGSLFQELVQDPSNKVGLIESKRRLAKGKPSFPFGRQLRELNRRASFFQFLLGFGSGILAHAGQDLAASGFR